MIYCSTKLETRWNTILKKSHYDNNANVHFIHTQSSFSILFVEIESSNKDISFLFSKEKFYELVNP